MGGLLSVPASFLGACCGSVLCGSFAACCSCNFFLSLPASRAVYTATILLTTAAALVIKYWGAELMPAWSSCTFCGDEGVLRVHFSLACTFAALALLTVGDTRFGAHVHTGFWLPKLLLFIGLLATGAFVPLRVLLIFGELSRWVAMLYLLFQIVTLIDLAYSWNEAWAAKDDELAGEWRWRGSILAISFGMYAASLAGFALMLQYLSAPGCAFNTALIACTLVASVCLSVLSISPVAEHGALLTSAVVTFWLTWLCYSALTSVPDAPCNPLVAQPYDDLRLAMGLVFGAASVAYSAWAYGANVGERELQRHAEPTLARAPGGEGSAGLADPFATLARPKADADAGRGGGAVGGTMAGEDEESRAGVHGVCAFQLIMFAVACYGATLLTAWRAAVVEIDKAPAVQQPAAGAPAGSYGQLPYSLSWASVWIQVASLIATVLLYAWSLVAPALFPDRDFSV